MINQMSCGKYTLDFSRKTYIMGILNVTPDSFSDGGKFNAVDQAVIHAKQLVEAGADILDIGGESTRPGHEEVSEEEEIQRVVPVIQALSKEIDIPISIDTYKAGTARKALKAGAHIINDVWGAKREPEIARVAAEYGAPIILMHNRSDRKYSSFYRDAVNDLFESIALAKRAGVKDDKIILDPGIGFAKDLKENIEMMRNLGKLCSLQYPVLLGTSRKSMIGKVLNLPVDERLEGTIATICSGIQQGCHIVRVHDVKEVTRAAKMMDALIGKGEING
ncbi:dihydropteroate synthase [Falsibacillus albus]|uniref:Dihydropteroate synthase n=1 Tax=Falsibacillus albus TaxID=2478915 RepID=A0A3L7JN14_9BACI|nr:dihydropteroate synthase [Falsibacillus albus]RLQ91665.1 dihydropteroate synthase [Falsibacillus albus]